MYKKPWALCLASVAVWASGVHAADNPVDWRFSQMVQVSQKGLVKVQLPLDTLSNAQPNLSDLRLWDPSGQEASYYIDRPMIQPARQLALIGMTLSMAKGKTVITGQVPAEMLRSGFDTLFLYTQTDDFLKPVTVEGSRDGAQWSVLVNAYPIFKQPGEYLSTRLVLPPGNWPRLRITLDDTTTPPIRIQTVQLYAAPKPLAGLQSVQAQILDISSDAHQTELHLLLPADNLMVDRVRWVVADGTFRRRVTASVKTYSAGEFRENTLSQGLIYRVALNRKAVEETTLVMGKQVPGRQLILRIENGDSRPLNISKVAVDVVPAHLVFDAPRPGAYSLWVGNLLVAPRNYDVSSLRESLSQAVFQSARLDALVENPAYRPPEPLPQVGEEGTDIDVSQWRYRKKVTLKQPGIQRIEPDLDVLAHNGGHTSAFRIVQNGKQLPYVVDNAGIGRELDIQLVEMPAEGSLSRWTLTLPGKDLPITSLRFTVQAALFQRTLSIYEDVLDDRGDSRRQLLGQTNWVQIRGDTQDTYVFQLYRAPRSNKLILETDNRDNPPIRLVSARGYYKTPRLLFKAAPGRELALYYGNDDVAPPQYDLELVAHEMLATPPSDALLGPEEVLKTKAWWEAPVPQGGMKYGFWGILALGVIGLLAVIAKLLPSESESKGA